MGRLQCSIECNAWVGQFRIPIRQWPYGVASLGPSQFLKVPGKADARSQGRTSRLSGGEGPIRPELSRAGSNIGSGAAAVVRQMRAERRRFVLLRLSFMAVAALSATSLVWAIPWVPVGMAVPDYNPATIVLVILIVASSSSIITFHAIWWPAFQQEPIQEFLRVLLGGRQLIRGRHQFRSRLAAECRRARQERRGRIFSLIVICIQADQPGTVEPGRDHDEERHLPALLVRSVVRAADIVGDSWPDEVWMLSLGAGDDARQGMVQRLARALANTPTSPGAFDGASIGSATFGLDGVDPDQLLAAARGRLLPLTGAMSPSRAA